MAHLGGIERGSQPRTGRGQGSPYCRPTRRTLTRAIGPPMAAARQGAYTRCMPPLDNVVSVVTPENIAFRYEVAGPMRRIPAMAADIAIRMAAWMGLLLLVGLSGLAETVFTGFALTVWLLAWFLLEWFYGGLLETYWNGQTIGKRLLGIRVVTVDGEPISGWQALLRNFLRVADLMPFVPLDQLGALGGFPLPTGLLGLSVPMFNCRYQRLGDLVCGTMVVLDDPSHPPARVDPPDPQVAALAAAIPKSFVPPLPLTEALMAYWERRDQLPAGRRTELAERVRHALLDRLRLPADTDGDLLLRALAVRELGAERAPSEARGGTLIERSVARIRLREPCWHELAALCARMESRGAGALSADEVHRLGDLYRATCADVARAEADHLPPRTVQFLHRLVARAHNQIYRSRPLDVRGWSDLLLRHVPQLIFRDRFVQFAFAYFWAVFFLSAALAAAPDRWPNYATALLGDDQIETLQESFSQPIGRGGSPLNPVMAAYYIYHNAGIGLRCFAGGLLVLPGLVITLFNAAVLGASFGYMARPDVLAGPNFFHFVTAHGPFELTAIVLSAGAGLKLGMAWIWTNGWSRLASLQRAAAESMPLMGASLVLFLLAALIESFISPSYLPYAVKAMVGLASSTLLMFYFVVLGNPPGNRRLPRPRRKDPDNALTDERWAQEDFDREDRPTGSSRHPLESES